MDFQRSDENAARWARRFEVPMLMVAALVIPQLLLDSSGVPEPWHAIGVALNWVIWVAFLAELVVMLRVSPGRWDYLRRNPLDLLIVVLTPPFIGRIFDGVRLLRLVRIARLMRLGPLVRWIFRSGGLQYAALFTLLVVLAAAQAFSVEENKSYFESIYWAVTTVTTVGYGNPVPTTTESKVIAMIVMLVGIGFFAALAGSLADRFIEGRAEEIAATEQQVLAADEELIAKVDAMAAQLDDLRASLRTRTG